MKNRPVLLIAMPWETGPSIQLGSLGALLRQRGFQAIARSFFVDALEAFVSGSGEARIEPEDYFRVGQALFSVGLGDWIFAVPPLRSSAEPDPAYLDFLRARGVEEGFITKALAMRAMVPAFLERCADEVLALDPAVVGFTSTFSQNVPSLALAERLKRRSPNITIVFGGANCDGSMGAALHRSFPWVDVVVRGEAERVLPALLDDLLEGRKITPRPGLCYVDPESGERVAVPQTKEAMASMDEVAVPDYDEFFERTRATPNGHVFRRDLKLPYEGARGCWWGEKSHCTFCGLNGTTMAFRSKPPERVLAELGELAAKYEVLDFHAVDNIIDMDYFATLLPRLVASGYQYWLFYETKANLKKEQLRLMRDAGIRVIQPGIESLSTPTLKLMKKGVTALQNIRLLKWCAEIGIRPLWNLIYGFPGESPEEYARVAQLIPSLTHLEPPHVNRLHLDRFSPYHGRPEEHGITITGAAPYYEFVYEVDEPVLRELAYSFEFRYHDGRDPDAYAEPVRKAVEAWQENARRNAPRAADGAGSLRYRRGPGFLLIVDRRSNLGDREHALAPIDASIYLACERGATPDEVGRALLEHEGLDLSLDRIRGALDALVEARLAYVEADRYLALAIPEDGAREAAPARARHRSLPLA